MVEYFLDVRLKEIGWNFVLLQEAVDVSDALFGVFLNQNGTDLFVEKLFHFCDEIETHMCVTQHFLHDKIVVDRFCEFFTLIRALGLFIIPNFFVELQLGNWLISVILAIIFKELKACEGKILVDTSVLLYVESFWSLFSPIF